MPLRILHALDYGAAIIDRDFKIVSANPMFQTQWDLSEARLAKHHSVFDVFPSLQPTRDVIIASIANGDTVERRGDSVRCFSTDAAVTVDWSMRPVLDTANAIEMVLFQTQILKPIEIQLRNEREEKERLAYALAGASDGIWDWNVATGHVYFSDRYCTMLGYAQGEIDHSFETWEALVDPSDIRQAKADIADYMEGRTEHYASRFRMRCKDGAAIWILSRGEAVEFAPGGMPRRLAGTHTDITEQVALESELIEARQKAEKAAQAERTFLSTMSHEIRTPLFGMIGMLDSIGGDSLSKDDERRLETARQSANTLLSILNSILSLSELNSGAFELVRRDVDLMALFEQATAMYLPQAKNKGLDLQLQMTPSARQWINCDAERLTQVLYNLISNAIKFSDKGIIKVTAACRDNDMSNASMTLEFSICDEGVGMTQQTIDHIFDRFFKVEPSVKSAARGTGLGLHIVHQLLSAMDGTIAVTSALGEGTTFRVQVPVRRGHQKRRPTEPMTQPASFANTRILVAEDNQVNRTLVEHYLQALGCSYDMVTTGRQAVKACKEKPYDLVLMDIQMPEMTGLEAITEIRTSMPALAKLPILALTANVFTRDVQTYLKAGANGHLAKPFNQDQMMKALEAHLSPAAQQQHPLS